MKYSEAEKYLESLDFRGIKLGLENTQKLLALLGDPHKAFHVVHVTGTNGKGSTCAIAANILTNAGIKNGLYTSPHLETFRERISINNQMINEDTVAQLITAVRDAASLLDTPVTYFEFMTAMAFLHFKQVGVKVAVIEVGLGGRFDSTNVVDPAVSVITSVSLDHQEHLGSTLKSIAKEKSGIAKANRPLILGVRNKKTVEYILDEAEAKNAPVLLIGRDFDSRHLGSTETGETFSFTGAGEDFEKLSLSLVGKQQVNNASVAIEAILKLRSHGVVAGDKAIADGVATVFCPGRFEKIGKNPAIILDGAHNPKAAKALCYSLVERFGKGKTDIVFGAMRDKDYGVMLKNLAPSAKSFTFYTPDVQRAETAQNLVAAQKDSSIPTSLAHDHRAILELIDSSASDGVVCITGSFYTVGELRTLLLRRIAA